MVTRHWTAPFLFTIALVAAGCDRTPSRGARDGDSVVSARAIPSDSPSIVGVITMTRTNEVRGSGTGASSPDRPVSTSDSGLQGPLIDSTHQILIEERPGQPAGSAKAWVTVRMDTPVLTRSGSRSDLPWDALVPGARVRVWFDGPVRESYPLQAEARVVVLER